MGSTSLSRRAHAGIIARVRRPLLWLTVLALAVSPGCFLDRSAVPSQVELDAGSAPDAGPPDAGPRDAGPNRDAGPPDAGPDLDAGTDAGPPPRPTCIEQYGGAEGHVPCAERPDQCEFATTLALIRSCESTCRDHGGECIEAWRNEVDTPTCQRRDPAKCTGMQVDNICICTRPPE